MDLSGQGLSVLLLGSGGREHAIAWKLSQSPIVSRIVCAPGNPGIARHAELRQLDIEDPKAVADLALEICAGLVVIGPEVPLAAGVADELHNEGIPVFGPTKAAARLEWDKSYAKEFMQKTGIPTAASRSFSGEELEEAVTYVQSHALPIVIKASGLAAGKGVVIAETTEAAEATVRNMLSGGSFGDAGSTVVVEEFMEGEEASVFAITDGTHYILLAPSQDHKRLFDGDRGPNTGGMGAYAPAPIVTSEILSRVKSEIVEPALRGMREERTPFCGCLFVGLMIKDGVPRVVEFNSRFGDPETQVVLPLYHGDFGHLLFAASTGVLSNVMDSDATGTAACVVMAAEGYPGSVRKGDAISGLEEASKEEGVLIFHAGTKRSDSEILTNGGRVLGVTAYSESGSLENTLGAAYKAVEIISFAGAQYRYDIGRRALMPPPKA